MPWPKGVERVRAKDRTYFYWNPDRGTSREKDRVPLPNGDADPVALIREVKRLSGSDSLVYPPKSIGALVVRYTASEDFKSLSDSTQATYNVHLNRFKATWGTLPAAGLNAEAVLAYRDALKDTPGMANHMLSLGRSLWGWAIPMGLAGAVNPFESVKDLATDDSGHIPWPTWAVDYVRDHAPPDIVRLERIGIITCQRESDLIRMGPEHRDKMGLWCRPRKTRKKRKAFCIPLTVGDAKLLDRWAETPITFTAQRWKAPIDRFRDLYLYSPKGDPYSPTSLRARWMRWLRLTEAGHNLCGQWQKWVTDQARRFEWDMDPESATNPTIHGLRGTGILVRRLAGHDVDQIANDIGMSRQMVDRYMRFRDQVEVAAAGRARLQVVEG